MQLGHARRAPWTACRLFRAIFDFFNWRAPHPNAQGTKMKTQKRLVNRKLSVNRETLRTLSVEKLDEVAGGWTPQSWTCESVCSCWSDGLYGCPP